MTKQAISGVSPAHIRETIVRATWPSNAYYPLGRTLGQAYAIKWPDVYVFRLGNLLAILSIPVALVLYFMRVAPGIGVRYLLTNRRIIVQRGLIGKEEKSVYLDRFDSIDLVVQLGQEWYDAGDLVFKLGTIETFRLVGVSHPEAFKALVWKAHMAYVGVQKAIGKLVKT